MEQKLSSKQDSLIVVRGDLGTYSVVCVHVAIYKRGPRMLGLISGWAACLVPAGKDQEGHVYFPDNVMSQINNLFAKTELKVLSEIFLFYFVTIVCVTCMCGHMYHT